MGVEKSATQDEIRKAYRKKALKEHPDKGGDPDKVCDNFCCFLHVTQNRPISNMRNYSSRNSQLHTSAYQILRREIFMTNMEKKALKAVMVHQAASVTFLISSEDMAVVEDLMQAKGKSSQPYTR